MLIRTYSVTCFPYRMVPIMKCRCCRTRAKKAFQLDYWKFISSFQRDVERCERVSDQTLLC